jgi:ADP-ribose pyrophosphatase
MNPDRGYRKAALPANAERVFEGKIFDVYHYEQELYDGSKAIFEKLVRPDTIVVFPILPGEKILMIEDSQPGRDTVLTAPSGRVEEGETPEETARRELVEETGYAAETLEPLFVEPQLSQKMDWVIYGFIGRNVQKVQEPKPDAGEKITERIVSFDEMIESIKHHKKGFSRDFGRVFFEAMLDTKKMQELKEKFFG